MFEEIPHKVGAPPVPSWCINSINWFVLSCFISKPEGLRVYLLEFIYVLFAPTRAIVNGPSSCYRSTVLLWGSPKHALGRREPQRCLCRQTATPGGLVVGQSEDS